MVAYLRGVPTRYRLYRSLHVDELDALGLALRLPGRRYWDLAIGMLILPIAWLIGVLVMAGV